jgi:crotonobetainyl-CoA:carnitine CoA-transferase CaiB-like acyl-CoA transferase
MKTAPAYDQIIQGLSGMMSVTGTPDSAPLRSGYPVADTLAGMTAAFAISSALVRRNGSGEGAFIDVSMLDAALTAMGWAVSNYLIAGVEPRPHGNDNFTAAPSGAFRAQDGLINIAANKQEQFEALVAAVGRPELATDPRFAQRESRKHHRGALTLELESALKNRSCAEWQSVFNKIGVPAGCVLTVPQALALPQVAQRGLLKSFDDVPGIDRTITVARSGFKLSGGDPDVADPPPELGRHTDDVLAAAGYSAQEIAALREAGIV